MKNIDPLEWKKFIDKYSPETERTMSTDQPVCRFGKTKYDSRIFDNLYRAFGDEKGGTVLTAEVGGELKAFQINVPYMIIKSLIESQSIGSLCEYDWQELDINKAKSWEETWGHYYGSKYYRPKIDAKIKEIKEEYDIEKAKEYLRNQPIQYQSVTDKKYFLDLAAKAKYDTVSELLRNADKIKEWLG